MISPEFFTSHAINSLRIDTAMTFAGLWCYADDYGRGEDDVDLIKATVWPRRREQSIKRVQDHLDTLTDKGLVCRYEVNGYRLTPLSFLVRASEAQPADTVAHPAVPDPRGAGLRRVPVVVRHEDGEVPELLKRGS